MCCGPKDLSKLISNNRHSGFLADLHKTKHTLNHIFAFPLPFVGITCASDLHTATPLLGPSLLIREGFFLTTTSTVPSITFFPSTLCFSSSLYFSSLVFSALGWPKFHSGFFCNILNRNLNEIRARIIWITKEDKEYERTWAGNVHGMADNVVGQQ